MQNYKKHINFIGVLETFKQNLAYIDVYYNFGLSKTNLLYNKERNEIMQRKAQRILADDKM